LGSTRRNFFLTQRARRICGVQQRHGFLGGKLLKRAQNIAPKASIRQHSLKRSLQEKKVARKPSFEKDPSEETTPRSSCKTNLLARDAAKIGRKTPSCVRGAPNKAYLRGRETTKPPFSSKKREAHPCVSTQQREPSSRRLHIVRRGSLKKARREDFYPKGGCFFQEARSKKRPSARR